MRILAHTYTASKMIDITKATRFNNSGSIFYTQMVDNGSVGFVDKNDTTVSMTWGQENGVETPEVLLRSNIIEKLRVDTFFNEMLPKDVIIPLSSQFGFKAVEGNNKGVTLVDYLKREDVSSKLSKMASEVFCEVNPLTKSVDVKGDEYYSKYIPLAIQSGVMHPQTEGDKSYFNPNGAVTVVEFLASLGNTFTDPDTIGEVETDQSIDSVATSEDYFIKGYNACLSDMSSPFFGLYKRCELEMEITRAELAYIIVTCWGHFERRLEKVYGGRYTVGVNTDWNKPAKFASKFKDIKHYKIIKRNISFSDETVLDINIQDYLEGNFKNYIKDTKAGLRGLALPLVCSLLELNILDLFPFEDGLLAPLKTVTRGELSYFLCRLASAFATPYYKG